MNNDVLSTANTGFSYIEKAYIPNTSYILVITDELKSLMQQYFSKSLPQFTLINSLRFDYPQTLSTYDVIHICCMDTSWAQIVFQLSHEFCHLMIGKPVTQSLRWFEESLAELASLFFLRKMGDVWEQKGILGYPEFSAKLRNYADNRMASAGMSISLSDIMQPDSALWKNLIANSYLRMINLQIAIPLLPVFEENPSLWHIVPMLGDFSDVASFSEFFTQWKQKVDSQYHSLVENIRDVFIVPGKTS